MKLNYLFPFACRHLPTPRRSRLSSISTTSSSPSSPSPSRSPHRLPSRDNIAASIIIASSPPPRPLSMDGGKAATAYPSQSHRLDSPLCHVPPSHLSPNVDCRVLPPPPTVECRRQHPDIVIATPTRHRPSSSPPNARKSCVPTYSLSIDRSLSTACSAMACAPPPLPARTERGGAVRKVRTGAPPGWFPGRRS